MAVPGTLTFKQADTASEFDQIHRLNYRIFAEEIREYTPDGSGRMVDRFHDRNIYYIAIEEGRVLGMVAANDQPPFSIESRLPDASVLRGLGGPLLEVRLLALDPDCRNRMILGRLLWELYCYARERRYSHLVISGITDKAPMYQRIGFRALGPAMTTGAASFIPMALSLENPPPHLAQYTDSYIARQARFERTTISLQPGPVEIAPAVRQAFIRRPVSHRSAEFIRAYEKARATLCKLSGGMKVAVLTGSGTTANDSVAAHLRGVFGDTPGLVLVNGEFGERLAGQASRAGLRFRALRWRWGQPWDLDEVAAAVNHPVAWIWAVQLETSAGVLNPLQDLISLAARRGVRVAADCVSSLGAAPLPSHGLWMSSGVSGKALGAYAGLSFVFTSKEALAQVSGLQVPASLDVSGAMNQVGPRFTVASSLLFALESALEPYASPDQASQQFARQQKLGRQVRSQLRRMEIQPIAAECDAAPCVTSFVDPGDGFVEKCRRAGFELGAESGYLRDRGWVQIATMGAVDSTDLDRLFEHAGINRRVTTACV